MHGETLKVVMYFT